MSIFQAGNQSDKQCFMLCDTPPAITAPPGLYFHESADRKVFPAIGLSKICKFISTGHDVSSGNCIIHSFDLHRLTQRDTIRPIEQEYPDIVSISGD